MSNTNYNMLNRVNALGHIRRILSTFVLPSAMMLLSGTITGQTIFGTYTLEHWDAKKGLPSDLVLNINTDNAGYLWLSGYDGLIRFDGRHFKLFNSNTDSAFVSNSAYMAFMDKKRTLWVPSINNIVLSYAQGKFRQHHSPWPISRPEVNLNYEAILFQDEAGPYILFDFTTKQFSQLNQKKLVKILQQHVGKRGIVMDRQGQILFVSRRRLYKLEKNHLTLLQEKPQFNEISFNPSELYKDSRGTIHLISDLGHKIWNGHEFVPYPSTENLRFQTFGTSRKPLIVEDKHKNLWMGTVQGLVLRRAGQAHFELLPPDHPLATITINAMVVDKENNLWLATESGLYKVSIGKVRTYSIYDGLSSKRVTAVAAPDSGVYLINTPGTQNFYWWERGRATPYTIKGVPPRSIEIFHTLVDSKKRIWMVTAGGVIIVHPDKSNQTFLISENVRYVYEDNAGEIWLGVNNKGIGHWEKDSMRIIDFPGFSFKNFSVSSIHQNQRQEWIITSFSDGVVIIDRHKKARRLYDTLGLPSIGAFTAHLEDDGTFWLPTTLGLFYWNQQRFIKVMDRQRHLENSLFGFVEDQQGQVWLPSNKGILRLRKADLLRYVQSTKPQPVHSSLYDEGDGMLSRQCVGARHSILTPDGKILVPTYLGLVEVDPQQQNRNTILPRVEIDPLIFDGKLIQSTGTSLRFPPGDHQFILAYSALSTTAPSKVRFRYRLDGYKNYWSDLTAEDRVTYTNLPAGKYTFRVKAANNDGLWSDKEATLSFSVRPFFYQTWWFWLLSTLALISGIQEYVRYRNRSILHKNEDLERTVAQRTQALQEANQLLETQKTSLEETLGTLQSTQAQLIQSEKLASLGELTAGIAHEIQNPLNFVNNFAEVSAEMLDEMHEELEKGDTTEAIAIATDLKTNLTKINHHGQRASAIVKGMLEHSRASTGVKEPTDLNALADEYLRLAYHGLRAKDNNFNATIETHFDPDLPLVSVIPQDIGRVLLNLINNAFYAVAERSRSTVQQRASVGVPSSHADTMYQPTVTISTQKTGDQVIIKVQDNGNGIPESIRDKIFQPFFTTKPTGQGTGLGLSLAYDIVTKGHGGTLDVNTKKGENTTMIIRLPLY